MVHPSPRPAQAPSDADLFRQEEGRQIGKYARQVWGPGSSLAGCGYRAALSQTQDLLSQGTTNVVFDAAACFARLVLGQYAADQIAPRRRALLAYGERDTLAMVRLHETPVAMRPRV